MTPQVVEKLEISPRQGLALVPTHPKTQEFFPDPASSEQGVDRAAFALDAVEKIFEWLAYSPNNPSYLTSDTYRLPKEWLEAHFDAIHAVVSKGLETISDNNEAVDLYHMEVIRDGVILHKNPFKWDMKKYDEEIEPLPKIFVASDFANAGIEDVLAKQSDDTAETDEDVINEHAVRAIGAMVLRDSYFTHLSEKYPESFSAHDRDTFTATFRQNILATVFKATRLSAESAARAERLAQLASEPEQAVA